MKFLNLPQVFFYLFLSLLFIGCSTDDYSEYELIEVSSLELVGELKAVTNFYDNEGPHYHNFSKNAELGFIEGFESAVKGRYSGGSIDPPSGSWYLEDALIGKASNDRKYGLKSMRIRNEGFATMSFDIDSGAKIIRIRHAKYGTNSNSTWRLIASYDQGSTWSFVGDAVTTSSISLNTVSFSVNETSSVRYGIRKTSGGSARINIDNFEIVPDTSFGETGPATQDSNITFGNPSDAKSSSNNYYLSKPDFALSYNTSKGTPNWVSWHLSTAWTGNSTRCNCFRRDTELPSNFFRATSSDYTSTGFDRGHICPSADRNDDADSNRNTYFMTNMAPQAPDNNRRTWVNFENYLRSLIIDGKEVHIIAGVSGSGGIGRNGSANTIDNGNITVPDSFWKVALVLPNGTNDINRVNTSTRVIAINVPNDQGISSDWTQFRTSVNDLESLTGYDFFENIPNAIESVLESRVDNEPAN